MIKFDEKIVGVWFLATTSDQDWMAALSETTPGEYELIYRFRYYDPESTDPFDGKDKKNWYKGTLRTSRKDAIEGIRMVQRSMAIVGAIGTPYEVLNNGDFNQFIKDFQQQPWVFARVEKGTDTDEQDQEFAKFMESLGADDGVVKT